MIKMSDFVSENSELLRQVMEPVSFPLSDDDRKLIEDMRQYLVQSQNEELAAKYGLKPGVGLAAPQIGYNKQIFVVYVEEYDENGNQIGPSLDQIFINPKIISHSVQQVALKEGEACLSVPREVPGFVPRSKRITIKFQDLDGNYQEKKFKDFEAIVVQHEADHLKGIMFYDHINEEEPWQTSGFDLL